MEISKHTFKKYEYYCMKYQNPASQLSVTRWYTVGRTYFGSIRPPGVSAEWLVREYSDSDTVNGFTTGVIRQANHQLLELPHSAVGDVYDPELGEALYNDG
jgi:hypothetical protein